MGRVLQSKLEHLVWTLQNILQPCLVDLFTSDFKLDNLPVFSRCRMERMAKLCIVFLFYDIFEMGHVVRYM